MSTFDYEAMAGTTKLEDITSDEHSRDILRKIRTNDPDFSELWLMDFPLKDYETEVTYFDLCNDFGFEEFYMLSDLSNSNYFHANDDTFGWLGHFIGQSKHLRKLSFCCSLLKRRNLSYLTDSIQSFCRGLNCNTSIEEICFCGNLSNFEGSLIKMLLPLFKKNQLIHTLVVKEPGCVISPHTSFAIANCGESLKRVHVELCNYRENPRDCFDIIKALKEKSQLEALTLKRLSIGGDECIALSMLLYSSLPKLLRLDLSHNCIGEDEFIPLVAAIRQISSLRALNLSCNEVRQTEATDITVRGWQKLAALLAEDTSNIKDLNLREAGIDDQSALSFATALARNFKLKKLALNDNDITPEGWSAFFSALREARQLDSLWMLNVYGNESEVLKVAASSLHPSKDPNAIYKLDLFHDPNVDRLGGVDAQLDDLRSGNLHELYLGHNQSISPRGWKDLANLLEKSSCSLKALCLSDCNINDSALSSLVNSLHRGQVRGFNVGLSQLNLGNSRSITSRGWGELDIILTSPISSLRELCLNDCNLDDLALSNLVNSLHHGKMKGLDLSRNHSVTPSGWRCVGTLLERSNSQLEEIHLHDNSIGDEEALIYANSLAENSKLRFLELSGNSITDRGWNGFLKLVCDSKSINKTFLSNHTFCNVGQRMSLPTLQRNLDLNGVSEDKAHVAMMKILNRHEGINVSDLLEWDFKLLPFLVVWFDRARSVDTQLEKPPAWHDSDDSESNYSNGIDILPDNVYIDGKNSYQAKIEKWEQNCFYQFVRAVPFALESKTLSGSKRKCNPCAEELQVK